ncbi:MAG: FISUMP domain-containing protein [Candidatus Falkowbacteria bacterium]
MFTRLKYLLVFLLFCSFVTVSYSTNAAGFSRNLSQGTQGAEVKVLQQYLNSHGYPVAKIGAGSRGRETTVFGPATKQALIRFQKANNITPANGYFGPTTRKVMATGRSAAGTTPKPKTPASTSLSNPKPVTPPVGPEVSKPVTPEVTPVNTYTIGGTIMGLTGAVNLRNNSTDQLILTPASASLFTLPTALPTGAPYNVTATPGSMSEHCYLINNSGTVASTNITTIQIACGTTLTDTAPVNPFTNPIIPSSAPTIHELRYTTDGNGTITGSSTQSITLNTNGTGVTATPNTGYHFTTWNDGLTNPTRTDINIRSNQTYTANFSINTYILTYTAGANGTLSGTTTQTVTHGSTGTEVVAIGNDGYMFLSWSDGYLTASRTDVTVTSTKSVTASFSIAPFITCGQTLVDARDGNTYPTVLIGTQCWTAKHMAYLPIVEPSAIGGTSTPHYYVYNYQGTDVAAAKLTSNYINYGTLYNHAAALTACPSGWHLPSDPEFTTLTTFLGGEAVAGAKLKSSSTWDGTNISGFNSRPGGSRRINGTFWTNPLLDNVFWMSTLSGQYAWVRDMYNGYIGVSRFFDDRGFGDSVRCLKD